jgi:hypothetical protein
MNKRVLMYAEEEEGGDRKKKMCGERKDKVLCSGSQRGAGELCASLEPLLLLVYYSIFFSSFSLRKLVASTATNASRYI